MLVKHLVCPLDPAVHQALDPGMKLALGDFKSAVVLDHVLLDVLYLGPEVGQLVAVVEAHKYTSSKNVSIVLKLDAYWQKQHITTYKKLNE